MRISSTYVVLFIGVLLLSAFSLAVLTSITGANNTTTSTKSLSSANSNTSSSMSTKSTSTPTQTSSSSSSTLTQTSSNTSSSTEPRNYGSILLATGLRLELFVNSTRIRSGGGISVSVNLANTINSLNNISTAAKWPIKGLIMGSCGTLNYPMGIAIIKGNYSSSNLFLATPLYLFNPSVPVACPGVLSHVDYYLFQPMSNIASVNPSPIESLAMNGIVKANGYWICDSCARNGAVFRHFDPGSYTVVAGDEWGDVVILYFVVSPPATVS